MPSSAEEAYREWLHPSGWLEKEIKQLKARIAALEMSVADHQKLLHPGQSSVLDPIHATET